MVRLEFALLGFIPYQSSNFNSLMVRLELAIVEPFKIVQLAHFNSLMVRLELNSTKETAFILFNFNSLMVRLECLYPISRRKRTKKFQFLNGAIRI